MLGMVASSIITSKSLLFANTVLETAVFSLVPENRTPPELFTKAEFTISVAPLSPLPHKLTISLDTVYSFSSLTFP